MSQKISRKDLHTLYESVKNCSTWKTKIEQTLIAQQLNDKIEVEDSVLLEAYNQGSPDQKKLLDKFFDIKSPKKQIDKIQTLKDVYAITGKTASEILPWKNARTKKQKSQNAFALIQLITEAYNNGVVIDFSNRGQRKYYPWFEKNTSGSWVLDGVLDFCYCADVGFGCYFASEEAARDAATKFKDVYLDYLPE